MSAIVLLFLLGIVLLGFEIITPGGILGVLGGLAMLGGCVLSFSTFGNLGGGIASFAALAVLGLTLYLEFVWLPKTPWGKKLFLRQAVDATSQPPVATLADVIGKVCEAETTLAPTGYVSLDGQRYEAYSRSGHVVRGAQLQVVGVDNFRLIVTKAQT